MLEKTTGYFQMNGKKIYYEAAGSGTPLVLLHAGFLDSRMWDDQFDEFARAYRVIRYDMGGFGKSDPVEGPVVRRHELYQLLKHLGIEKAALAGTSLGGEIALDFALEHPEMVLALVVISAVPGGFEMQGEAPSVLLEMFSALGQNDQPKASELQLRLWIDGAYRTPEQVDPKLRRRAVEMTRIPIANGTFFKADAQPLQPLDPPAVTRLKNIHVPVMVIAGALDHPELLRAADVMVKDLPSAQKWVAAGAAHIPGMEKPVEFNQVVVQFLNEAEKVHSR